MIRNICRRVRYATACHISDAAQADTIRNVSPAKLSQMYLIAKEKNEKCINLSSFSWLFSICPVIDADTFQVPFVQPMYTFVYLHFMITCQVVQFRLHPSAAEACVRFACIPSQFALEADFRHDFFRHFPDAEFLSGSHVNVAVAYLFRTCRIRILEVYVQQHMYAGIRHFFAPEEFAQRLARAPRRNDSA